MFVSTVLYLIAVCELSDISATNEVESPLQPRIIGGRNAAVNEFPYVVAVLNKVKDGDNTMRCTGSIVSRSFILTAGHCIKKVRHTDIVIVAGSHDWTDDDGSTFRYAEYLKVHRQHRVYNRSGNDIGLIKMTQPLDYDTSIQRVILPRFHVSVPVGKQTTFAGWGLTQFEPRRDSSPILQVLDLTTISKEDCTLQWITLSRKTICASGQTSYDNPIKDICHGDSGGPLLSGNLQWGIAVTTSPNCTGKLPIRFIEVSRFTRWIKITISRDHNSMMSPTAAPAED